YYAAFCHGADIGSMGFEAYARTAGFPHYYGRTEYNEANPGNDDFDGHWGIWDEKFFQFYANNLSTFRQPFATALFSLSSHHPFAVPAEYEGAFPKGNKPIRQCIAYTDHSLKLFFEKASKEAWYKNTLFVFTADHTNSPERPEYETECGLFSVPVVFYHPGSNLKGFREDVIAQQIDIMPTVLGYLGYDRPYVSFGCDLLRTPPEETYAVNYINGIYQFFKGDYLLQFDGQKPVALYAFKTDKLLKNNLLGKVAAQQPMEEELKAIIQQYMTRMNADELIVK
ncbi:LTA synthase family protein, partial [Bacteroides pyogenes]|uniref:LTA synthase family protein n=1 Tax=Bacteroides pyogenes TaxID=310300 RepID=UPI002FDB7A9E